LKDVHCVLDVAVAAKLRDRRTSSNPDAYERVAIASLDVQHLPPTILGIDVIGGRSRLLQLNA
jgi:hypothetical protein